MLGPLCNQTELIWLISLTDSKTLYYCSTLKLKHKAKRNMHRSSTTAIITATEYTNGIFLQIHMFKFFMDLCVQWNSCHEYYCFASLGIFMHQGCRMQRLTESLHIFCMDKRLLEDFVLKCNQWKYWMSFIACGCRFSSSYTVYSWLPTPNQLYFKTVCEVV